MRQSLVSILAAVAVIGACSGSDGPTAPDHIVRAQGMGNDPDRIRVHEHHTEEFVAPVLGCTEPLLITGTAHILLYAQNNPGGRVHFHTHTNLQGVSAVGQITGTRYRVAQNFNAEFNYAEFLDPPKLETNHVFRYRVMGSGPENNFRFDATYHVTMTPDGRVTATFLRIEGHCAEDGKRGQ